MKYVSCYGGVWKLSDRSYRRFLRNAAAGKEWSLNDYGKMVAPHVDVNVTDMTAEDAKQLLKGAEPEGRLARVGGADEQDEE